MRARSSMRAGVADRRVSAETLTARIAFCSRLRLRPLATPVLNDRDDALRCAARDPQPARRRNAEGLREMARHVGLVREPRAGRNVGERHATQHHRARVATGSARSSQSARRWGSIGFMVVVLVRRNVAEGRRAPRGLWHRRAIPAGTARCYTARAICSRSQRCAGSRCERSCQSMHIS